MSGGSSEDVDQRAENRSLPSKFRRDNELVTGPVSPVDPLQHGFLGGERRGIVRTVYY